MRHRRVLLLLVFAVLTAACAKPEVRDLAGSESPAPAASGPTKPDSVRPVGSTTSRNGWHLIGVGARPHVLDAAPDGSGVLVSVGGKVRVVSGGPADTAPTLTDPEVEEIAVAAGADQVTFKLARTPWGARLIEPRPEIALSPDGRSAAVSHNDAIWLINLRDRTAHRLTADAPKRPPNLLKYVYWEWAGGPSWSADGAWVYFRSTRKEPGEFSLWRVPTAGGAEQEVPEGDAGQKLPERTDAISPDRAWAVILRERGKVHLANLATGHEREIILPPGAGADAGTVTFSPDGSRFVFHMRVNEYEIAGQLAVVETATGEIRYLTHPTPARDHISPAGWLGRDRVIVRMQPWDQSQYIFPKETAEAQLWMVDLNRHQEPQSGEPAQLLAARVAGVHGWSQAAQSGAVTGGEVTIAGESAVFLRFDRPVSRDWLARHVVVEGGGAKLQAHGASLGIASVPLPEGRPGDDVLIGVPTLNFALRVRRVELSRAAMQVRTPGGSWQDALDERVYPAGPLEVRLRFSRPMKKETIEPHLREMLPSDASIQWDGPDLLVRIPEPSPVTRLVLSGALDELGLPLESSGLPAIRSGPAPLLVAVGEQGDVPVIQVVPEITDAAIAEDRESVRFTRYLFLGGEAWSSYHLSAWQRLNLRTGEVSVDQLAVDRAPKDLSIYALRGDQMAGLLATRWLGPDAGYLYEVALVIRDEGGRELKRSEPVKAFFPPVYSMVGAHAGLAWSPNGTQIAFMVARSQQENTVYLYDVGSGAVRELVGGLQGSLLRWSPDGRLLVAGRAVLDAQTGRILARMNGTSHLHWSPGGDRLLYNLADWGAAEVLEVATGGIRSIGLGMPVGWDLQGRPLMIRWEGGAHRWLPMGE